MNNATALLARCGPLTDSVRLALRFFFGITVMIPVILFLVTLILSIGAGNSILEGSFGAILGAIAVLTVIWLASTGWQYLAFWLLLKESAATPALCLLLRAFRSDATSEKMRAWLKAALGPGYKLSGIRPPRERTSRLSKLLSPLATGLRYSGSRQFEMEAPDHNWMARLLATFVQSRFVFIDVRELTSHVMDEVLLAWRVFGQEKCVFIVNDRGVGGDGDISGGDSDTRWRSWLAKTLTDAGLTADAAALKLLRWPSDDKADSATFCAVVQRHLQTIPDGTPVIEADHLGFVEQRVPPEQWDTKYYERDWFLIVASYVLLAVIAFFSGLKLMENVSWVPTALMFAVIQSLFWTAWGRALRQRRFAARVNPAGPPSARRVWGAGCVMALHLILPVLVLLVFLRTPMVKPGILHERGERRFPPGNDRRGPDSL